jgi:hypothetical protein
MAWHANANRSTEQAQKSTTGSLPSAATRSRIVAKQRCRQLFCTAGHAVLAEHPMHRR